MAGVQVSVGGELTVDPVEELSRGEEEDVQKYSGYFYWGISREVVGGDFSTHLDTSAVDIKADESVQEQQRSAIQVTSSSQPASADT